MDHFNKIGHINVSHAIAQLDDHPEIWNTIDLRRGATSPHRYTSDIWVRSCDPENMTGDPHFSVFYPAWDVLPALHPIVFDVMRLVHGTVLGGILITRIPAGKLVLPHNDKGSWHAEFYSTKVYIPLRSNPHCINHCEDAAVSMPAGDIYIFDNLLEHSVVNRGTEERITLIICMKAENNENKT